MAQLFTLHPRNPQGRLISQAVAMLRAGALIAYPTDSSYALGCLMNNPAGIRELRRIRRLEEDHFLTLVCADLSALSSYARVDNTVYRLLRAHTPGPYTFVLKASRDVPRKLQHPKRRTVGIRVPDHEVSSALLEALGEPLMSTTARLPGEELPLNDGQEIVERLNKQLACVLDAGACAVEPTSVVDLSEGSPRVLRRGLGALEAFELAP